MTHTGIDVVREQVVDIPWMEGVPASRAAYSMYKLSEKRRCATNHAVLEGTYGRLIHFSR